MDRSATLLWYFLAILLISHQTDCESGEWCGPVCHKNATCTQEQCVCDDGFLGDGFICENIDECEEGTHDCDQRVVCVDTIGSFECRSSEGGGVVLCGHDKEECIEELRLKIEEIRKKIAKKRKERKQIEDDVQQIDDTLQELFPDFVKLENELEKLKEEKEAKRKEMDDLLELLRNRKIRLNTFLEETKKMAEDMDRINSDIEDLEAEMEKQKKDDDVLAEQANYKPKAESAISKLDEELASLQKSLESLERMCRELED